MNIKVSDLSLKYFGGYLGVDMVSFETNESMAILGKSLSGKTSLLRCIAGLEKYTGTIENDAKEMVFTFDLKSLNKNATVKETLMYPLTLRNIKNAEDIVKEKSKIFGINEYLDTKIKELSQSDKKLVILTRAILRDADLYLLDNPLKDVDNREKHFKKLLEIMHDKFFIYTTDLSDEAKQFNKVMLMAYKKCIGVGTVDELALNPNSVDVWKLLAQFSYEYLILHKSEDGDYYVEYEGKKIDVPEPISRIYDNKEVIFAKAKDIINFVYFDAATEYRISKR